MLLSSQKGVSLYLALMMMFTIVGIALGVSAILVSQIKVAGGMEDSVTAFFAADTGIERVIFQQATTTISGILDNGASYSVQYFQPGADCSGGNYCLKSVGVYQKTRRAIEIIR